jgi:hypothetical protein
MPAPEDIDYPHYWIDSNYCGIGKPLIERAQKKGVRVTSLPYCDPAEADALCFWECPRGLNDGTFEHGLSSGKPMYLFVTEHHGVVKENADPANALFFDKIFTYYPDRIDGVKYIESYPMYFQTVSEIGRSPFEKRKFSAMIGHIPHGGTLSYNERALTAMWFSEHCPERLDLFAKPTAYSASLEDMPCYRGSCVNKRETLSGYRFSFCYENSTEYPGYVSEKIFDSIFAGCIPVYMGPPDRDSYLPRDCYIDRSAFACHEDLFQYLEQINEAEFERRLDAMQSFASSEFTRLHSPAGFADLVVGNIIDDIIGITV